LTFDVTVSRSGKVLADRSVDPRDILFLFLPPEEDLDDVELGFIPGPFTIILKGTHLDHAVAHQAGADNPLAMPEVDSD
jgi:hypothetical protein